MLGLPKSTHSHSINWLVVDRPHFFSICSAAPSWCLVFVHVVADLLSASAVVIWLYYGSVVAALFKIQGEVLRQAVHNVQVLPLCCRLEQCFPEYLVEAIWIYLGFCGMKGQALCLSRPHARPVGDCSAPSSLSGAECPSHLAAGGAGGLWVFSPTHLPCTDRSLRLRSSPGSLAGSGRRLPKCWQGILECTRLGIEDARENRSCPSRRVRPTHRVGTSGAGR